MSWIGLYEKALPDEFSWKEKLLKTKELGFDFIEISIDESDERLSRLDWSLEQKRDLVYLSQDIGIPIISMCLSGHRRFPFGSKNPDIVAKAREIMNKAFDFSLHCGIRNIQMAGYDVYYEESTIQSKQQFKDELALAAIKAAERQIMISIEIMDYPFMNSITKFDEITEHIHSPWLTVYPDVGNLTAWWNNVAKELKTYISRISAIHLKDTLPIGPNNLGQFRDLALGQGKVDFIEVFQILKEVNYQGAFVIELWANDATQYQKQIIDSLNLIKKAMQNADYVPYSSKN
ncbi:hexulose-6-phosphate isomerase [Brevinema andersonii]|uniref:L-ribulose-5-phosphate 3-epimerase n=1 Tax=Brevinema andersonii TaxID=34097 RepID=A0A1I1DPE7_BREAD|nr:L-ribulose-5-phosphate 3-epimerase [Brevinema andersonii]SFB76714.1 hexulose-6-phosphate isomerase [Brevinema andersonii]